MTDKKMFIESEGGLFRGITEVDPDENWHPHTGWIPYTGAVPKKRYWGSQITEAEAIQAMADLREWDAARKFSQTPKAQASE